MNFPGENPSLRLQQGDDGAEGQADSAAKATPPQLAELWQQAVVVTRRHAQDAWHDMRAGRMPPQVHAAEQLLSCTSHMDVSVRSRAVFVPMDAAKSSAVLFNARAMQILPSR